MAHCLCGSPEARALALPSARAPVISGARAVCRTIEPKTTQEHLPLEKLGFSISEIVPIPLTVCGTGVRSVEEPLA